MASIWKKISDVLGFTTAANGIKSLVKGDGVGMLNANFLPGVLSDYVNNIKNWDNDSSNSSANSASTVNSRPITINEDGSVDMSGVEASGIEDLIPYVAEWLAGSNPNITRMWNTAEAQKERDWQTEMSNTAYQRSVADMKAAGINPILAYSQGGATSGVGAVASSTPSSASSVGPILEGVNSIINTVMNKDIKSDKAAIEALKYQDSHSATVASNKYYKSLTKLNDLKLREASSTRKRVGF